MVTEQTFQVSLDAEPDNIGLKKVFADWLEEQGDWRAAGYRWMGDRRVAPRFDANTHDLPWWTFDLFDGFDTPEHIIPCSAIGHRDWLGLRGGYNLGLYVSRQAAEEAICRGVVSKNSPQEDRLVAIGGDGVFTWEGFHWFNAMERMIDNERILRMGRSVSIQLRGYGFSRARPGHHNAITISWKAKAVKVELSNSIVSAVRETQGLGQPFSLAWGATVELMAQGMRC